MHRACCLVFHSPVKIGISLPVSHPNCLGRVRIGSADKLVPAAVRGATAGREHGNRIFFSSSGDIGAAQAEFNPPTNQFDPPGYEIPPWLPHVSNRPSGVSTWGPSTRGYHNKQLHFFPILIVSPASGGRGSVFASKGHLGSGIRRKKEKGGGSHKREGPKKQPEELQKKNQQCPLRVPTPGSPKTDCR